MKHKNIFKGGYIGHRWTGHPHACTVEPAQHILSHPPLPVTHREMVVIYKNNINKVTLIQTVSASGTTAIYKTGNINKLSIQFSDSVRLLPDQVNSDNICWVGFWKRDTMF